MQQECNIAIQVFKASEFNLEHYKNLGLGDLTLKGYGLKLTTEQLSARLRMEYLGIDHENTIFLAELNEKIIGSFVLGHFNFEAYYKDELYHREILFWDKLNDLDPNLSNKIKTLANSVYEVESIVTLPEFQRQGIQRKLVLNAVDLFNPLVILGTTKYPQAVISRANILSNRNYRTFYGLSEVSPDSQQKPTQTILSIIEAYYNYLEKSKF